MSGKANARRFNDQYIRGLRVKGRVDIAIPGSPGLILRVTPAGQKSWAFRYYRGKQKVRFTFGSFSDHKALKKYGLADAKAKAMEFRLALTDGRDPEAEARNRRNADTVSELLDTYVSNYARQRKKSWREDERIFERDVKPAIGHIKANELRRAEVLTLLNGIRDRGAGIMANRTLAAMRKAFNWGISQDLIERNPCVGMEAPSAESVRMRVLSKDEIRSFWTGLDDAPMSGSIKMALKLALVTGQRIGEVCAVERHEINQADAVWSIPEEKSKNGLAHTVPLSSMAIVLFLDAMQNGDASYLFPSRSRNVPGMIQPMAVSTIDSALRRSLSALNFADKPIWAHDLRRTVATGLVELGIAENTIARVLNHKSEIGKTITGRVYIRHGFETEKRHALETWCARLQEIVNGSGNLSNVVSI